MPDDAGFTMQDARRRLLVDESDLPRTAREVAALLAASGQFFERGGCPVSVVADAQTGALFARAATRETVVRAVHERAQPYVLRTKRRGEPEEKPITLHDRLAALYLDMAGQYDLLPLHGIAYGPLLDVGGAVHAHAGYHPPTGFWCASVPNLAASLRTTPTRRDAKAALLKLRRVFATFPFADAPRRPGPGGIDLVDLRAPPGMDESGLLAGLLTAICRPSLSVAPGLLIRAPNLSGSGTGKGLLAKAICTIAFGASPAALTSGGNIKELEARLGTALMDASPAVFLDNFNGATLQSDMMASVLTERRAKVRVLGLSKDVWLNPSCFLVVAGNAVMLSEDLVRRFLVVELDARTEDPEARPFTGDFLAEVQMRRAELLGAALTIWRWAQLHSGRIARGLALGSYQQWCGWVRDALVALGAADPVARVATIKAADTKRQDTAAFFGAWHECHGDRPMKATEVDAEVVSIINPHGRSRQFIASELAKLVGTRVAGLMLTRSKPSGRWSTATYAVTRPLPLE
ncbi:MAG: hypothetical protein NTY94_11425 [Alphaproteobacteria bacterium]|nr:hypothetical protein [Alphaproteobacteria bacterium]